MSLRVLVLHNSDFDEVVPGHGDTGLVARAEVADVADAVAGALARLGLATVQVRPVRSVREVVRAVRQFAADVVFNLCESFSGDPRYEPAVAAILARLGVPFTGSSAQCLRACLHKQACGDLLRRAGVRVPASVIAGDTPPDLGWPLILKPNSEDGSTGIWSSSVVDGPLAYAEALARLRAANLTPVIAQRYVAGRELNVAVLGESPRRLLPVQEIDFSAMPEALPRIVSYASKWVDGSAEWQGTRVVPAVLSDRTARAVALQARAAAEAVGMGSYGRVDLRVDDDGRAWVVDVNPNCALAPDAGFASAAKRAGICYSPLIAQIVAAAVEQREWTESAQLFPSRRTPRRASVLALAREGLEVS